jgi:hypothetical protein
MVRPALHAENRRMVPATVPVTAPATRVLITAPPFVAPPLLSRAPWDPPEQWPCRWLMPPADWALPLVLVYRLVLDLAAPLRTRIHVSADERYDLWLDGTGIGSGVERGDEHGWAYDSYDLDLPAGRHVLAARVWALGRMAPWAQRSLGPGFLCAATGEALSLFGTGVAPWRLRRLDGYRFTGMSEAAGTGIGIGPVEDVDLAAVAWAPGDASESSAWIAPVPGVAGNNGETVLLDRVRRLRPAALPPQHEERWTVALAAACDVAGGGTPWGQPVADAALAGWQALLAGSAPLHVAPRSRCRVLIDLGDYFCGRPELSVAGGRGANVSCAFTEALLRETPEGLRKGHRDLVAGGRVRAASDVLRPDGGSGSTWRPLWWRAGRWLEVVVETGDAAIELQALRLIATGYPFEVVGRATGIDAATAAIHAACQRTWRSCAHETFMDCPYYEQLMYVGDTRIQALLTYVQSRDARLPARAISLFASGRQIGQGLVPDAYPAACSKRIPPFALWWVGMVHDFVWWRGDLRRWWLPEVRSLLERFLGELGADGLWPSPVGWNFLDWVAGFNQGTPPGGEEEGRNCSFNWQLVHALGQWAELEDASGEPELAARARRRQVALVAKIQATFWDETRGRFSEDPQRGSASEHAQVLALLSGTLPPAQRARVVAALLTDGDLVRTSAYFSHYLFEVYGQLGRADLLLARLDDWCGSLAHGLRTTPESFGGEGRSDCHAWSAHPLFHHLATQLGVRPAAPGFARVRIAPCCGPLTTLAGSVAHPAGVIQVALQCEGTTLTAQVDLPSGIPGELVWQGVTYALVPGPQSLVCG